MCTCVLVGNFPGIQVVPRDYLNPTLGSLKGLFLEFRWDYAMLSSDVAGEQSLIALDDH